MAGTGGKREGSGRKKLRYILSKEVAIMLDELTLSAYARGEIPDPQIVLEKIIREAYQSDNHGRKQ
jgi:hypothetical protein